MWADVDKIYPDKTVYTVPHSYLNLGKEVRMSLRDSTVSLSNITKNRTAKQCLGFGGLYAIPQSCSKSVR